MAWTTPKTDFASETLTSSQMNAIGANLEYLFAPNSSYYEPDTTNYTTSSGTEVSIDNTLGNFRHQIDTDGGNVMVFGTLVFSNSSAGANTIFNIEVDGADAFPATSAFVEQQDGAGYEKVITFLYVIEGLSDGTHTFELKWRVGGGTATLYASTYQSFFGVARMG